MQINPQIFDTIANDVRATLAKQIEQSTPSARIQLLRWQTATEKAIEEIQNNPFISLEENGQKLLILSETSSLIHVASVRSCGCQAGLFGQPCKHRAMLRLAQLYTQAAARTAKPIPLNWEGTYSPTSYAPDVLVKPQPRGEKYGAFDI